MADSDHEDQGRNVNLDATLKQLKRLNSPAGLSSLEVIKPSEIHVNIPVDEFILLYELLNEAIELLNGDDAEVSEELQEVMANGGIKCQQSE